MEIFCLTLPVLKTQNQLNSVSSNVQHEQIHVD